MSDLFWDFTKNKAAPIARQMMEVADRETFSGDKPSIGSVAKGLTVPIIIQEGIETSQNEQSASLLSVLINDYGLKLNHRSENE